MCDRVAVIRAGRLLAVGKPSELGQRDAARHVAVEGYGFTAELLARVRNDSRVRSIRANDGTLEADLDSGVDASELVALLVGAGAAVNGVRVGMDLEKTFVSLVSDDSNGGVVDQDGGCTMIADTRAVLWKEFRVVLWDKGSLVRGLRSFVPALAVFGIVLPWQFGRELIDSPAALVVWIWVPCLMAVSVVADAFAGERDRHTLETLLSMPLADAAIFMGKFAAAVLYGWAFTVIASLAPAGVVNVLHPSEAPIFYPPAVFAGVLIISLLVTALLVSTGILVSLRSPTVRQASQTVSVIVLAVVLAPAGLSQLAPAEWIKAIVDIVDQVGLVAAGIVVAVLLAAIDAAIVVAGVRRFNRGRLIAA